VQQGQEPLAQLALLGLTEPQEQLVWELKAVQAQLALLGLTEPQEQLVWELKAVQAQLALLAQMVRQD
jgi:lipid-A-disaccharide synthase-like uncharacterized protein